MIYYNDRYRKFAKEMKVLLMSVGRSNFILTNEIDRLIVKYNINLKDLKDVELE